MERSGSSSPPEASDDTVEEAEERRKREEQLLPVLLKETEKVLSRYKNDLRKLFLYFSMVSGALTSEDVFEMNLKQWLDFVKEAGLLDVQSVTWGKQAMSQVFSEVNCEDGARDYVETNNNDDNSMTRFEFYEAMVRLAMKRSSWITSDVTITQAFTDFMEEVIKVNIPPVAFEDTNTWRRENLYCPGMDRAIQSHLSFLESVFKLYTAKDYAQTWCIEHWTSFLTDCKMLGHMADIDESAAKLMFGRSQMMVTDELKRRKRAVSGTFWDFVEAVVRLSKSIFTPPAVAACQPLPLPPAPPPADAVVRLSESIFPPPAVAACQPVLLPAAPPPADNKAAEEGGPPSSESAQNQLKSSPESLQNKFKSSLESVQNRPKTTPESVQNQFRVSSASIPALAVEESPVAPSLSPTRLVKSFESTIELMVSKMMAEWGGVNEEKCSENMLTLADEYVVHSDEYCIEDVLMN
eukprot:gene7568-721_t